MNYFDKYIKFRNETWERFEQLVKNGALFPELLSITYPKGQNPPGLDLDTDGNSWFLAKELIPNKKYVMHKGEDLIVGTGLVQFIDVDGMKHELEPNILDLYWLSEMIGQVEKYQKDSA